MRLTREARIDPSYDSDDRENKVEIEVLDSTDTLFAAQKANIDTWDAALKAAGK